MSDESKINSTKLHGQTPPQRGLEIIPGSHTLLPVRIIPEWSELRRLGNSRLVRSSIAWFFLIPIVAKLFRSVNTTLVIPWVVSTSLELDLALPFSWTLLYFASMAWAVASVGFYIACPSLIRDYPTLAEFKQGGQTMQSLAEWERKSLKTTMRKASDEERKRFLERSALRFAKKNAVDEAVRDNPGDMLEQWREHRTYRSAIEKILTEWYALGAWHWVSTLRLSDTDLADTYRRTRLKVDRMRPGIRLVLLLCYLAGFVLIVWILGENFVAVLQMM